MTDLLSATYEPLTVPATTAAIMVALRTKFCAPEYALFENVGNAGSRSSVYADGVAMNMWASRGYALTGFEVKASRSDWLRELKQPGKSEPILTKCDFWYLVAPDEVFQIDEVPISWGVYAFKSGKLFERRKAPKLEPKSITREFVAQMFRRHSDQEQRDIKALVDKEMVRTREDYEKRLQTEVATKTRHLRHEGEKWGQFLEQIGQEKRDWVPTEDVANAVKIVMAAGIANTYSGLAEILRKLRGATEQMEAAVASIPSTTSVVANKGSEVREIVR